MCSRSVLLILLAMVATACSSEKSSDAPTLRFTNLADGQEVDGPMLVEIEATSHDVELFVGDEFVGTFTSNALDWYPIGQGEVTLAARAGTLEATVDVSLVPRCGDGVLDGIELCDDTNLDDGDGCDAMCGLELEPGTPIWAARMGEESVAELYDMAVDEDGNTFVLGAYRGSLAVATAAPADADNSALFLAKIDSSGEVLWTRGFGSSPIFGGFIALGPDDSLILTGEFVGTLNFGGGLLREPEGVAAHYIAKLDRDGEHIWSRAFDMFEISRVAVDETGFWVLINPTGKTDIDGLELPVSGIGDWRLAVVRFSHDGEAQSFFEFASGLTNDPHIVIADDGDLIVAASSEGPADLGGGVLFDQSDGVLERAIFVGRFSPDGTHLWSRGFGAAGSNRVNALEMLDDGSFLLAGEVDDGADFGGGRITVAEQEYDHQEVDGIVAVLDAAGELRWQQIFTGPGPDRVNDAAVAPGGEVYAVAHVWEGGSWDGGSLMPRDILEPVVVKFAADGQPVWSRYEIYRGLAPLAAAVGPRGELFVGTDYLTGQTVDLPSGSEWLEGPDAAVLRLAP